MILESTCRTVHTPNGLLNPEILARFESLGQLLRRHMVRTADPMSRGVTDSKLIVKS